MKSTKASPAPQLTDAECDAILREQHGRIRLDREAINAVDWIIYRRSQYATLREAEAVRATASGCDIVGYTAALDTFEAMANAVNLLDHRSAEDDVRVVIILDPLGNETWLPECWLGKATTEIHRHLIRTGNYYTITQ